MSNVGVARHVLHVAVAAVCDPVVEMRRRLGGTESDEADQVES
jgi:hypothetical protein